MDNLMLQHKKKKYFNCNLPIFQGIARIMVIKYILFKLWLNQLVLCYLNLKRFSIITLANEDFK